MQAGRHTVRYLPHVPRHPPGPKPPAPPAPGCSTGSVAERRWFWQLANNGNVHIHAEESGPTTALRLKVRLRLCATRCQSSDSLGGVGQFLSRDMHAARVHNFTAPSAAEETEPAPAPAPVRPQPRLLLRFDGLKLFNKLVDL